jgi:hypothetical protein
MREGRRNTASNHFRLAVLRILAVAVLSLLSVPARAQAPGGKRRPFSPQQTLRNSRDLAVEQPHYEVVNKEK